MFPSGLFLLVLSVTVMTSHAFLALIATRPTTMAHSPQSWHMVGGRGWDNSDYLSGLSGDSDDRQKAAEDYQEFSDRRRAFLDRQKEIMKSPQGRAFLEKQQQQQQQGGDDELPGNSPMPGDEIINVTPGSGGGSRMAQMMAQAQRMKAMQDQMGVGFFEQKFAVPLDDEEEDDKRNGR